MLDNFNRLPHAPDRPPEPAFPAYVREGATWTAAVVVLCLLGAIAVALWFIPKAQASQQRVVPLSTEADEVLAQFVVSEDGKIATFRAPARDDLTVCVEPTRQRFGPRVCFTLRDVRTGKVGPK